MKYFDIYEDTLKEVSEIWAGTLEERLVYRP